MLLLSTYVTGLSVTPVTLLQSPHTTYWTPSYCVGCISKSLSALYHTLSFVLYLYHLLLTGRRPTTPSPPEEVSGGGLREPHPKPSLLTTGTHGGLLLIAFHSYRYHPLHFCKRPTTHSPPHGRCLGGGLGRPLPKPSFNDWYTGAALTIKLGVEA